MHPIYDIDKVKADRPPKAAASWTAIIPAAGRGSRLHFPGPKILYPILGKPILNWLTELLSPLCSQLHFVVSPDAAPQIEPSVERAVGPKAQITLQYQPTGMADAIALCDGAIQTPYTVVIWGDQITARARTLNTCMAVLETTPACMAVIPTIERANPYIHFIRDAQGKITRVFEARESDETFESGESDCGLFFFRTKALFNILRRTRGLAAYRGAKTRENNFLSLIPLFDYDKGTLATVRLPDANETVGVNTPEDAQTVSRILKGRHEAS